MSTTDLIEKIAKGYRVTELIDTIADELCTKYCKYNEDEGKEGILNEHCENCPLTKL